MQPARVNCGNGCINAIAAGARAEREEQNKETRKTLLVLLDIKDVLQSRENLLIYENIPL